MTNDRSGFLDLLNAYITVYLPCAVGVSDNTIKSYKCTFRLLIEFMYHQKGTPADKITFENFDYDTLSAFLSWIEKDRGCSASTKNQRLSALASFSNYAQNRDFSAASVFRSTIKKLPVKKAPKKKRAVFSTREVALLLRLPNDKKDTSFRDKVLLSLMYASGARSQEICDLKVGNIQFQPKGASLNITGKGGKSRRIGIPIACAAMLKHYIGHRKLTGKPERHVFSSQTHEHMTVSCIEEIFKKYVTIAKNENPLLFQEDSYPPHSMRHSTASHMLEAGVPLAVIKNFLGHASIQSTQIYAEISQNTVDKYLRDWNEKWFPNSGDEEKEVVKQDNLPNFLT